MRIKTQLLIFGTVMLSICLLFGSIFRRLDTNSILLPANTESRRVVVIDAGHGGEDGGAIGVNGVLEKDLNLAVARTIADLLRADGYTVIETRTDDRLLYEQKDENGHKKRADLANRLAYMQTYPECVFVSIHMNTYPVANCEGLQVWYSPNLPESKILAESVQSVVCARMQPDNTRRVKPANSLIYLLHKATVPAILIECGFLSTPAECEKLSDKDYQRALALAIFSSLSENLRV